MLPQELSSHWHLRRSRLGMFHHGIASWRCQEKTDKGDQKTPRGEYKRVVIRASYIKQHAAKPGSEGPTKAHPSGDDTAEQAKVPAKEDIGHTHKYANRKEPCADPE